MASLLLIGPDPQTREILKLRFEVEDINVSTALGKNDFLSLMKGVLPDAVIIDLFDYDAEEIKEIAAITKELIKKKLRSVLLLPRGQLTKKLPKIDLIIRKPYDLNVLVVKVCRLINTPKRSCSSRRGSRRRS